MKFLFAILCITSLVSDSPAKKPYYITGIKIWEVDQTSTIIWTRLKNMLNASTKAIAKKNLKHVNWYHTEVENRLSNFSVDDNFPNDDHLIAQP